MVVLESHYDKILNPFYDVISHKISILDFDHPITYVHLKLNAILIRNEMIFTIKK